MLKKLLIPLLLLGLPFAVDAQGTGAGKTEAPLYVPGAPGAPNFPGGPEGLSKYIADNITYPKKAKKKGIQGTVYIDIMISRTGKITEAKVVQGIKGGELLEEEALRVIKAMPDWIPDAKDPRQVMMTIPVKFKLNK